MDKKNNMRRQSRSAGCFCIRLECRGRRGLSSAVRRGCGFRGADGTSRFPRRIGGHPNTARKFSGRRQLRSIAIPGVAAAEIEALLGQGEAEVTIRNQPIAVAPGIPTVVAKSKRLTFRDYGYNWEISGKNGFYSLFHYYA